MSFFKMKPIYVSYNPLYPILFKEEKDILEKIFESEVISITHFGSSSVPNLGGKPIIDIWVAVKKMPLYNKINELLESNGYELRSEEEGYIRRDKVNKEGIVTHCMHISTSERDSKVEIFLRSQHGNEYLQKYDLLKRQLVSMQDISMMDYRDGKTNLLKEIREEVEKLKKK